MHQKTQELRTSLRKMQNFEQRFAVLHNAYQGETAYIVSCGPSVKEIDLDVLKAKLSGKLVLAVKQSYEFLREVTDFHIYNCANYKEYAYSEPKPVVFECTTLLPKDGFFNRACDLKSFIYERRVQKSLAVDGKFEDYEFSKVLERPYGPGIMYEAVFHFAVHLGVKEIVTIGWDNSNSGLPTDKLHFYDTMEGNYIDGNDQKQTVNRQMLDAEEKITIDAIKKMNEWLTSKDIVLRILSERNPAPKSISRIKFEDIKA